MGECDRLTIGNSSRLPVGYNKLQHWLARQPAAAAGVKPFDFRSFEPGISFLTPVPRRSLKNPHGRLHSTSANFSKTTVICGADHVAQNIVDGGALRDCQLGLSDGAVPGQINGDAAQEVENAYSPIPTFAAHADKFGRGPETRWPSCGASYQTLRKRSQSPASRQKTEFSITSRIAS